MAANISEEQRQALKDQQGRPLYVVDMDTNASYVLLPADAYQKVRALFESDDFDISETYALQDRVAEEAWSDPDDAAYDDYDAHRTKQ